MQAFQLYVLFALATAFAAIYELVMPVIHLQLEKEGKVDNKYIIYATFFLLCALAAPFVFFSCIIPSMGVRFRITLQEALFSQD